MLAVPSPLVCLEVASGRISCGLVNEYRGCDCGTSSNSIESASTSFSRSGGLQQMSTMTSSMLMVCALMHPSKLSGDLLLLSSLFPVTSELSYLLSWSTKDFSVSGCSNEAIVK